MNNDSEDAIRLEVKLFSGYYFDKISSASISDVHHDSHSNHIWFVFAKVKSSCVVCVSYTAKSIQKVTGLRQAVAKVYAVSRPDQSSYKLFHVDEEQNPLAEGLTDMQIADWITNDSNDFPVENNNPCKCNNHCEPPTTEKTITVPTTLSTPYQKPSTYSVTTSITGDMTTDGTPAATRSTEAEEVLSKPRIATIPTKIKRTPVKSTGNVVRNMKKPNKKNEKDKDSTSKHRTSDSGPDSGDRDSVPLKDTINTDAGTMTKMAQMNTMRNGKPSVIGGSTTKPTTTKDTTARGSNATTGGTTARTTTYSASEITTPTSTKSSSITPMTPTSATIASKTSITSSPTTTTTSKPSKTTTASITTSTTAVTTTTIVTPTTAKPVQVTSSTTSKSSVSPATFTSSITTAKSLTTASVTTAKSPTTASVTTAKSQTTSAATAVKPTVTTATPSPGTTTVAAKVQTTPVPAKPLAPSTTPVADLILEANRNKKIMNDQKKDVSV
uniref:Alpha-macroglobulin receptor-binding domain-containing protein n=1 Tax=Schizaphis graminum TaxID=13262 RepID=A0A2S2P6I8_SCHGA